MTDQNETVEKTTETVVEKAGAVTPAPLGTATEAYRSDPVQDPRAAVPSETTVEKTTVTETAPADADSDS